MVHLINKETFKAKKRVKTSNYLTAIHVKALVLDVKNLSKENSEGKKPEINYLCDLKYNSINENKNPNNSYRFLKRSLETDKINFGQLRKCKEINLEHENNANLPEQLNTWWVYEYYFLVFFFLNTFFVYKKILHPISLLPYFLSLYLWCYLNLNSPKIYKIFALFVNLIAFVISSVCCLDFIHKIGFILKEYNYYAVLMLNSTNLSLLGLFLLITLLPRKRFKFPKSYLVIPIFALYSFLVFIYFDFITTIPLVLGLGVMVVINLETDIYSNKYKEDLISNLMMFLVGLGNVSLGLCHCLFSLYFLNSKINFS